MFPVLGQYLPYFIELEDGWTWYSKYVAKELNLLTGLATFHVSRLFPFRSTVWQCDVTVWQNASVTYQVSTQPAPHVSTYLWDFGFIDEKIMIMYFLFSQSRCWIRTIFYVCCSIIVYVWNMWSPSLTQTSLKVVQICHIDDRSSGIRNLVLKTYQTRVKIICHMALPLL